jgi:hypothetical protein
MTCFTSSVRGSRKRRQADAILAAVAALQLETAIRERSDPIRLPRRGEGEGPRVRTVDPAADSGNECIEAAAGHRAALLSSGTILAAWYPFACNLAYCSDGRYWRKLAYLNPPSYRKISRHMVVGKAVPFRARRVPATRGVRTAPGRGRSARRIAHSLLVRSGGTRRGRAVGVPVHALRRPRPQSHRVLRQWLLRLITPPRAGHGSRRRVGIQRGRSCRARRSAVPGSLSCASGR